MPTIVPAGDYVLCVEVAQEFDFNATYNATIVPVTGRHHVRSEYGQPYRGQPSVVYRVPFTVGHRRRRPRRPRRYAGYGDPDGARRQRPPARHDDHDRHARAPAPRGSSSSPTAATCIACASRSIRIDAADVPPRPHRVRSVDRRYHAGDLTLSFVAPGVGAATARKSPATRSGSARPTR